MTPVRVEEPRVHPVNTSNARRMAAALPANGTSLEGAIRFGFFSGTFCAMVELEIRLGDAKTLELQDRFC
jgi:hypothetical protein